MPRTADGVTIENVQGPVATGDGSRVVQTKTYIEKQIVEGHPGPDLAVLRTAYLNHVFETSSRLSLSGIDPKAASSEAETRLNLGAVYTALLTLSPEQHDRLELGQEPDRAGRRLSALAQLDQQRHLVLLGDPGSGKKHVCKLCGHVPGGRNVGSCPQQPVLADSPIAR